MERRVKEAFKTALAMVLAYGIALSWDWANPYWAGLAVAVISLPTAGQSIEKGAMRMFGTLVASIAALTLIALFPQDRWLFFTCTSVFVAFCAFMITSGRNQYFWYVSGFVALVICTGAGPNAENAFSTAMTRTLETGLGIVVYTMISVFLWPQTTKGQLEGTARKLLQSQRKLFQACCKARRGDEGAPDVARVPVEESQLLAQLGETLNAAASESYEVRSRRDEWLFLHQQLGALLQALDSWRESLPETRHLNLPDLLSNLDEARQDIEDTFDEIALAWEGKPPAYEPRKFDLEVNRAAVLQLTHLERAALVLTKANFRKIAAHCHEILGIVRALNDLAEPVHKGRPIETAPRVSPLDPDRLGPVLRITVTLWVAFLIWIYVDPPGHASFVQNIGTIGLALVMIPQVRPSMFFWPFTIGAAFAGFIYVFVMPQLSSYLELGTVLFASVFMICFLFSEPRQGLLRVLCLVTLLALTAVQNQQSYSFASFANGTAMLLLGVVLLTALSYVPFSPRPEKVFLRLVSRYARYGADLLERVDHAREELPHGARGWKLGLYRSGLKNIPLRLAQMSQGIDFRVLGPESREHVKSLLASVHALNVRIFALEEAHRHERPGTLTQDLQDDMAGWRHALVKLFRDWSDGLLAETPTDLAQRLNLRLAKIETRMEEALQSTQEGAGSGNDSYLDAYRLLGSYRGLSEATLVHSEARERIDWSRWREARF